MKKTDYRKSNKVPLKQIMVGQAVFIIVKHGSKAC